MENDVKKLIYLLIGCLFSPVTFAAELSADKTVLITGANRGIGLGLVEEYVDMGWNVIATARRPDDATDLQVIAKGYNNLAIEQLDVTRDDQIKSLAKKYRGQSIDLLINNAGIKPGSTMRDGIAKLNFDIAQQMFDVNVLGPLRVIQALLPNVEASTWKKIVNVSSFVASFEAGPPMAALYNYRSSKAMLNAYTFILGKEMQHKGITAFSIHPGSVNVDPDQQDDPNRDNQRPIRWISIKESTSKMIKVIEQTGLDKNGLMVNYDKGEVFPF
jgi:NAD(P)-dependent dehydrogenase (short-subunit alcohol dehydrogenase family)